MKKNDSERHQAIAYLRGLIKPGDTVFTSVKHVSQSGMSRIIDVHLIRDNEPMRIAWKVGLATGTSYDKKWEALRVGGCGMDMCFHTVYLLGRALFPAGFAVKGMGRNGDTSGWDKDGGYALKYRSL